MNYIQRLLQKISAAVLLLAVGSLLLTPAAFADTAANLAAAPAASSSTAPGPGPGSGAGGGGSSTGATSGSQSEICEGIGLTGGDCDSTNSDKGIASFAATIINILSLIGGIVAVIMVVVGGLRYATSGGDSNATAGARGTITYALVGLLVVAIAQLLVHFVLNRLSNVTAL